MKKLIISAIAVITVSFSLSSCCKQCTHSSNPTVEVCEKNYATTTDYNNALSAFQANGYTCQ